MKIEIKQQIDALTARLIRYAEKYYNEDAPKLPTLSMMR